MQALNILLKGGGGPKILTKLKKNQHYLINLSEEDGKSRILMFYIYMLSIISAKNKILDGRYLFFQNTLLDYSVNKSVRSIKK